MSNPELLGRDRGSGLRRVLIFCDAWGSGGIESFLTGLLLHMDLSGLEIEIVASELRDSVFTEGLERAGIRFRELSGKQRNLLRNGRLFRRMLAERQYDVLHLNVFHGFSMRFAAMARRAGVPVRIIHSHGAGLRKSRTRTLKLLLHRSGRALWSPAATDLWACSRSAAAFLFPQKALKSKRIQWIPNGVDTERFRFRPQDRQESRHELGMDACFVVGFVGRLSSEKNPQFLLPIFAKLSERCENARLLIAGDGELRLRMEEDAKALGLDRKVCFTGATPQVEKLLSAMDVFLFPSLMEGLGIAAVEAQASGLPVVCSDRVPEEAKVTEGFYPLSLEDGPERWAETILSLPPAEDRSRAADRVRQAGFEISDVAGLVRAAYMR